MKKIFAIALALVMVLSMASAFASQCTTGPFNWDCATSVNKCGKAKVEVIPLVKANDACADWKMMDSTCAAAVTSDNVYFALKLTVDKDVDPEWYGKATLTLSATGVAGQPDGKWNSGPVALSSIVALSHFTAANDESGDGWVYYLTWNGTTFATSAEQTEATDKAEYKAVYNTMSVGNASKAKVCATLKSESVLGEEVRVGDFYVRYIAAGSIYHEGAPFMMVYTKNADGSIKSNVDIVMDATSRKIVKIEATTVPGGSSKDAEIKKVLDALNLGCGFGVCITEDALKANFGWKEKTESCFSWSDKAPAVVDAECVVAIPKTGDVSVVAYAVMAVVAAAGAMLKK